MAQLAPPIHAQQTSGVGSRPLTAGCEGLAVSHFEEFKGPHEVVEIDRIRVVVPDTQDGAMRAAWRIGPNPHEVPLAAPDICVIPASRDCLLTALLPSDFTVLTLDRGFCDRESLRQYGCRFRITDYYVNHDPFIRRIANVLVTGFRVHREPDAMFLESTARDLARHVTFTYGRTNNGSRSKGMSGTRLARVLAKIDSGLKGALPLAELAEEAHMSEFHFSRMFRFSTGYSPHTYITLRRMDRAKELLSGGETPLAEIAAEVGYKTQAHFTSVFHSYCGMTPGVFRRAHGQRRPGRRKRAPIDETA